MPAPTSGKRPLREVGDRRELAKLPCGRARLELASADPDAARATVAEAGSVVDALGVGPASELAQAVESARVALAGA